MIKIPNIPKKLIYSVSVIGIVGVLFGAYFASKGNVQPTIDVPMATIDASAGNATFGSIFSNFILGRSVDGSAIGSNTPIVRATKFSAGERAGMRIQTSSEVVNAFPVELRFLRQDTGEETPALQSSRLKLSVKPGLRSYCCLAIPKEAGNYTLGILRDNSYIGTLGGIVVVPAKKQDSGSVFGL